MTIDSSQISFGKRRRPFFTWLGEAIRGRDSGLRPWRASLAAPSLKDHRLAASSAEMGDVLNHSPAAIIFKDKNNQIVQANATYARILGLPLEDIIGRPMQELAPHDAERYFAADQLVMAAGQAKLNEVDSITLASGDKHWLRLDTYPRYDQRGEMIGVIVFAIDITEQLRGEAALATLVEKEHAARIKAEHLGRIKDEFLVTLSHELRTPLTPIIGWTELLLSGDVAPHELQNILQTIRRNAKSELHLIDNLLDTANIMSGGLVLAVAPVELTRLARDVYEQLRPSAEAKQLQFMLNLTSQACSVCGDAQRLHQMLEHIVINAIKFTPAGGHVRLGVERNGTHALLKVSDSGVGIKAEYLPFIFDRFSQGDTSNTRSFAGLGIGLTLVRHIASAHRGSITVASAGEHCGTTFTIMLESAIRPKSLAGELTGLPLGAASAASLSARDASGAAITIFD